MTSAVPTRRAALRGVGAAVASLYGLPGCTATPSEDDPPPGTIKPDPDVAVVGRALAASADLAQRYQATITAFPDFASMLAPPAVEHAAHIAALDVSGPNPSPGTQAPSGPSGPPVPPVPAEALDWLAAAERASAAARVADLLSASPSVARLLASIAASQAAHAALLAIPT